jgi:cellulose biosynthesis protein BcsQ
MLSRVLTAASVGRLGRRIACKCIVGAGYENRLREVLDPLRDQFDVILLDTPPGRGNLSGMAVLAADGLLIPALAADLDVRGAASFTTSPRGRSPICGSSGC